MSCAKHKRPSWKCDDCAAEIAHKIDADPALFERCRALLSMIQRDAMLRQGDGVRDLMAFVLAEKGRASDPSLKETLPLCLYFGTEQDRDEFVALIHEAKPNMISRALP